MNSDKILFLRSVDDFHNLHNSRHTIQDVIMFDIRPEVDIDKFPYGLCLKYELGQACLIMDTITILISMEK